MNVFTAIKYPIDINFLASDLLRIPPLVLINWWDYAQTHYYAADNRARIPCNQYRIHAYLNNSTRMDVRKLLLEKLKEMLTEYEE